MLLECSPLNTYGLSVFGFLATFAAVATPALELFFVLTTSEKKQKFDSTYLGLFLAQSVVGLALSIVYLSVPRRPDVFFHDKLVDRQYSGPLLYRVTFGWADPLLKFAIRNRGLDIDDLNFIDTTLRSKDLHANFEATRGSLPLWKLLLKAYWPTILLQYFLTLIYSFAQFSPQIALFGLLKSLEDRELGQEVKWRTWQWVISLGVFEMTASTLNCYLYWVVYTKLAMPIKQQLAAFVFAKAMRRKDVKGAEKPDSTPDDATDKHSDTDATSEADSDDEDDPGLGKSRQSIINLVVVDADVISDAVQYNHLLAASMLELAIACTFLVNLLGWKATFSGLSIAVIVLPVNVYTAKKVANAQTSLMKYRDQKVAVLTEVLQGIRQIKFSAAESSWQQKVSEVRERELGAQWRVLSYDIALLTIWLLGPIMLSAVSLAVYASINGKLTASVAFTAMSVFETLEVSFAVLPELISDFVEAWVSMGRIDKHLDAPEKGQVTVPSETISFEKASVAWPVDDEEASTEERFVLRNLNMNFPAKGLTVISGKTGSGKSLLLATILGEADILDGTVRVPQPPPIEERHDELANSSNWLIDSAIAYVSQTPWIENASVRQNILFDLPHDATRYDMVLSACALKKDLDMLTDGDLTDIGANGINLSGGQKWRVSFARALYSRASILVMDDIFSAVDAHTGRHLFEQALTGELGQGRTRILVTHHVGLCLPRTDYAVFMEEDGARCGTIEELKKSDSLASLLLSDKEGEEPSGETAIEVDDSSPAKEPAPKRKLSAHHPQVEPTDNTGNDMDSKSIPKKFMEDEGRSTGSIKKEIYARYFKTGGNTSLWLAGFSVSIAYQVITVGRVSFSESPMFMFLLLTIN
jgi:ABC-type multidrug transport system fused ATPase/permease subunit